MPSRLTATWVLAVAILSSACGADDAADSSTPLDATEQIDDHVGNDEFETRTDTSELPATTAAPDTTNTTAPPSTEMGATMPPTSLATQDAFQATGGDQSAFCAALAEFGEGTDADLDDPAALEVELARGIELIEEVARLAEPERAPTYEQMARLYRTLYDLAEANDFDHIEALLEFSETGLFDELLELVEVSALDDHEVCGAAAPPPSEDDYAPHFEDAELILEMLATDAGRELLIEEFLDGSDMTYEQAACFVDNLDVEALAAAGPEDWSLAITMGQAFQTCEIDIDEFNG